MQVLIGTCIYMHLHVYAYIHVHVNSRFVHSAQCYYVYITHLLCDVLSLIIRCII